MTQRIRTVRDEKGVALPLALFALLMLSGLLLTFLTMSGTEALIARNHLSASRALHIADAGIEHAVAFFPSANIPTDPTVLLNGFNLIPNQSPAQPFPDGGTYTVIASQNPAQQAAGTFLLRSTATLGNASRQITALVASSVPAPRGSVETLVNPLTCAPVGQPKCTEFDAEPYGVMDGKDWNAPTAAMAYWGTTDPDGNNICPSIASCGTPTSGTDTYGAFANSNSNEVQISGATAYIAGTGCPSGPCSQNPLFASVQKDTTVPLTRWDNFLAQAIPRANRTLTVSGPNSGSSFAGDYTGNNAWGTPAAPQITVINHTGPYFNWNANVHGAGVLIIQTPGVGPGGAEVEIGKGTGLLHWQGLIIVKSPGRVSFEVGKQGGGGNSGVSRIFGQAVNASALYSEIEFENDQSFIKYSSAAMRLVRGQFPTFRGWQEVTTP